MILVRPIGAFGRTVTKSMRIEAITGRKIVVELSSEDMDCLDITYEALDYASVDTRRVIWVILDRVREHTGCDIDPSGQLLIDAMPRPTGGCILFFTIKNSCVEALNFSVPANVLRKQEMLCAAFEFDGVNALLDCAGAYARALRSENERLFTSSELFTDGTRYRLLLCPAQELSLVRQFFGEYAQFCGEDSFAADRTREHWRRVGDAQECQSFERMGGLAGRERPRRRAGVCFTPGNVYASIEN